MHSQLHGPRFLLNNQQMTPMALVWYDCPILAKIMTLTLLLRLDFRPNGNHHHKKGMNAQSELWWWCHPLYKNPSRSMKKVHIQSHSKYYTKKWVSFYFKYWNMHLGSFPHRIPTQLTSSYWTYITNTLLK